MKEQRAGRHAVSDSTTTGEACQKCQAQLRLIANENYIAGLSDGGYISQPMKAKPSCFANAEVLIAPVEGMVPSPHATLARSGSDRDEGEFFASGSEITGAISL